MKKIIPFLIFLLLTSIIYINVATADNSTNSVLDTLQISSDGSKVTSNIALQNGVNYQVRASGIYFTSTPTQNNQHDAMFSSNNQWTTHSSSTGGLYIDKLPIGTKQWGEYNSEHLYQYSITGNGSKISLWIYDETYSDNLGSITVQILGPVIAPQNSSSSPTPEPTEQNAASSQPTISPNSSSNLPNLTINPTPTQNPIGQKTDTPNPTTSNPTVNDSLPLIIGGIIVVLVIIFMSILLIKKSN